MINIFFGDNKNLLQAFAPSMLDVVEPCIRVDGLSDFNPELDGLPAPMFDPAIYDGWAV